MNTKQCCLNALSYLVIFICLLIGIFFLYYGSLAWGPTENYLPHYVKKAIEASSSFWTISGFASLKLALFGCWNAYRPCRRTFIFVAILLMLGSMLDRHLGTTFNYALQRGMPADNDTPDSSADIVNLIFGIAAVKMLGSIMSCLAAWQSGTKYGRLEEEQPSSVIISHVHGPIHPAQDTRCIIDNGKMI